METILVSVIIPVYNKENFLQDTIQTLLDQTFQNAEVLFVDDLSTDHSCDLIRKKMQGHYRLIQLAQNSGAAQARNRGIQEAKGRYICFLDADDLWKKDKLEQQLLFMTENGYAFTFTDYEYATIDGKGTGRTTHIPKEITYKQSLKNTTIFTSTVMIDTFQIPKEMIYMPNVPYEDTATWWQILKKYGKAHGLQKTLSLYRTGHVSLSSNKLIALGRVWHLYRKVEGFSIVKSAYYFMGYAWNAFQRRYL